MQQNELISIIEEVAPPSLAAPWDNSGMQVAGERQNIELLAVCLDPSVASVQAAIDAGADMLLSHHPLSMKPRFVNKTDSYHKILSLLLNAKIPLYSAHTSLDVNPRGPVAWLATELKLQNTKILEPVSEDKSFGYGLCGDLPEALELADIIKILSPYMQKGQNKTQISLAGPEVPKKLKRIAICPGSGSSMIAAAENLGADLFITGDIKYHAALESRISLLDVGHFMLEEEMMRRFAAHLCVYVPTRYIPGCDPLRPLNF